MLKLPRRNDRDGDDWRRQRIERALAELRAVPRGHEVRTVRDLEVRAESSAGKMIVAGYAALWDTLSENLGGFKEKLRRGCFRASLAARDVLMLADHNTALILGRQSNDTLDCDEDETGLRFRCVLADTTAGRDVYELCRRGDLRSMSFAFSVDDIEGELWDDDAIDPEDGRRISVRTVLRASLYEISCVAMGAYAETTIGVSRSAAAGLELRSHNRLMRAAEISEEELIARQRAFVQLARLETLDI